MREKLKKLQEKTFKNVQVLTLEEVKYITGGLSLDPTSASVFGTTKPLTTPPPRLFM